MKSSKKLKVDQVINSLLESDNDFDDDSFEEKTKLVQKTPLKSIDNRLNIKKPTLIEPVRSEKEKIVKINKFDSDDNSNDDDDNDDDDDMPLGLIYSKRQRQCSDSEDEDVPLSVLISKKKNCQEVQENLIYKLNQLDKKYDQTRKKLFENGCNFFRGIHNVNSSCDYSLELDCDQNELSYVDGSDREQSVPSSPILQLQENFLLTIKNSKRKI